MTTIEEHEREVWPDPGAGSTNLVRRCTELRRKPLSDFTVEDLRIMLGQEIAVPVLLPRAVDILVREPLAEGDLYPGDLLRNVLRLPDAAWSNLHVRRERLADVLLALVAGAELRDRELRDQIVRFLAECDSVAG
ncbi:contact-dependent growth inhibition system immunity protein [Micromonospora rhizosphaerae]|uniref:contact-dependent growth inhibition system immunity protein n=1 Tax=Micromonospora rhizosphaerae TaxID=568872 RepID=UPI000B828C9B|nr:contact-dependent growth inhibition system immunity protein [Micromonospora rhizosphaerae]